jgi:glycosyltransferase involved in cell wall biosynthesis
MLSSILQQEGDPCDVLTNVAYMRDENSTPSTEAVLDYFEEKGLNIKRSEYTDFDVFCKRGNSRNKALKESEADWIMFSDCDMIFPPNWFEEAKKQLTGNNSDKCLHTGRHSTFLEETKALIKQYDYPCEVPLSFKLSADLPSKRKRNIGAGFCQIVNVAKMEESWDRVYVYKAKDNDWSKGITKARSDTLFRRRIGRQKIGLPWLIHLQHERDSDFGYHIEVQR